MAEDIKYMDIEEFHKKGYLQELNRQFLHPLGLALEVRVEREEPAFRTWLRDWFDAVPDGPDHIDIALALLKEFGVIPGKPRLSGVWDYRDDPEGIRYEGVDLETHAKTIELEMAARFNTRFDGLGYWVQPAEPA